MRCSSPCSGCASTRGCEGCCWRHPDAWRHGEAAIVQETLRTRPVLWLAGRTLLRPLSVGGETLPAGTLAYACSYLTHTRADLWPDPYRFDPSRLASRPQPFTW